MKTLTERDRDRIAAILDHCDRIEEALSRLHHSKEEYDRDVLLQDAVKMNIFQIGELANTVSDAGKTQFPEIPWHLIIGTRNVIAHAYQKVSEDVIWNTACRDVPLLKKSLEPFA